MKKLFTLLILCLMLLICCSCSNSSGNDDIDSKSENDTTTKQSQNSDKSDDAENTEYTEYTITHIDEFYTYHFSNAEVGYLGDNPYARFKASNGCYGYIDSEGNVVVEPLYEEVRRDFDEDIARVKKDGVYMYINRDGKVVFTADFDYENISEFENDYFWIETMEETIAGNVYTMTYYKVLCDFTSNQDVVDNFQMEFYDPHICIALPYDEYKSVIRNVFIEKAFSIENATNAGEMSDFYEAGYAIVNIPEKTSTWLYDGVFINTEGDICHFEGIKDGESITDWHRNFAFISQYTKNNSGRYVYLDFGSQSATEVGQFYDEDNYLLSDNFDYYFLSNGYSWKGVDYGDSIILCDLYIENNVLHTKRIINLSEIDEFGGATIMGVSGGTVGFDVRFTVYLKSKNGVYFSAVIDDFGDILVAPTKEYQLGYQTTSGLYYVYPCYAFCENGLCKAKDTETGLFGYIDLEGNWAIQPQYTSATDFCSMSNVAVVNNGKTIINSDGEIIFTVETAEE